MPAEALRGNAGRWGGVQAGERPAPQPRLHLAAQTAAASRAGAAGAHRRSVVEIVGVLADRELSTRKAEELTDVNHSEFARIRKAKLDRFTIDRLVIILNRLGQQVDVGVSVRPDGAAHP